MNIANPSLSVSEAVEKLKALGNEVIEVDKKNRRVKVLQLDSHDDERWVCDFCGAYSRDYGVIAKHERVMHIQKKRKYA